MQQTKASYETADLYLPEGKVVVSSVEVDAAVLDYAHDMLGSCRDTL